LNLQGAAFTFLFDNPAKQVRENQADPSTGIAKKGGQVIG
jgi:hypothetical protein